MDPIDEPKDAALVVLARALRLLAAQLVAGRDQATIDQFEAAFREEVAAMMIVDGTPEFAEQGRTLARVLVEVVLLEVRGQWLLARETEGKPDRPPSKLN